MRPVLSLGVCRYDRALLPTAALNLRVEVASFDEDDVRG